MHFFTYVYMKPSEFQLLISIVVNEYNYVIEFAKMDLIHASDLVIL